jgi:phosphopantetheinyl transferase
LLCQCLKESYVKAVGVGIGHDLQAIEFKIKTKQLSKEVCLLAAFKAVMLIITFCAFTWLHSHLSNVKPMHLGYF